MTQGNSPDIVSLKATASGKVQGVGFRDFIRRRAMELGVVGYIRNLDDGSSVELYVEGERDRVERLLSLFTQGPPGARVTRVEKTWGSPTHRYSDFSILYY